MRPNTGSNRYKKQSVTLNDVGDAYYKNRTSQVITYNMFKNPVKITETNRGTIDFEYGISSGRSYSNVNGPTAQDKYEKYYTDDFSTEIIYIGNTAKIIHYISGDPYSAPAMYVREFTVSGTTATLKTAGFYYLHRDYQGSIMAITNSSATVLERRHYDPWGNVVKVTNTSGKLVTNNQFILLDRGYTGHEHFFSMGIIHMNGRIYDPVLRSFMGPDNYIQDGENSQNYNRYAYVLNNPLRYTDPSGEFSWAAAGVSALAMAVVNMAYYTIDSNLSLNGFSGKGLLISGISGAVSGFVANGIGQLVGTIGTGWSDKFINKVIIEVIRAGMHGISQGAISGISGGDFFSGFTSGFTSSAVASGVEAIGIGNIFKNTEFYSVIVLGTISGGVSSTLSGGNFWIGAGIGLTVSAFNHEMHKNQEKQNELWAEGLRKAMANAKIGEEYDTKGLVKLGVPKSFANKISSFKLESKTQVKLTFGRVSYTTINAIPKSTIRLNSRTALWNIENATNSLKLSSDILKFTYEKGKTINYFYISNKKNVISYNTKFHLTWSM